MIDTTSDAYMARILAEYPTVEDIDRLFDRADNKDRPRRPDRSTPR